MHILVIQTAFLGDVILTTPLLDALASSDVAVDIVATPAGAQALSGHRSVRHVIVYDKKGSDRGLSAFLRLGRRLRAAKYDVALLPHRSLRSVLLPLLAGVPRRIGFDRSTASWSLTDIVTYRTSAHEIDRNLDLLRPLGRTNPPSPTPTLTIGRGDEAVAGTIVGRIAREGAPFVAIAPGSVWKTKRWPEERFRELAQKLSARGIPVVVLGGNDDVALAHRIVAGIETGSIVDAAGQLSVLQSAAVIRASSVLVTNDSAPLHLAAAVGTPVVSIFGATSPSYGFGPRGPRDVILETEGLSCRPCAIHGGDRCPVGTFECMLRIDVERVEESVLRILQIVR